MAVDVSGVSPEFGDDAQPDPPGGRALHQPDRLTRAAPRALPRRRAGDGHLRRGGRRSGKTRAPRRLAVPGRRRAAEEGAGLELQRPRQGQGVHPRLDVPRARPATSTSTTSSSSRRRERAEAGRSTAVRRRRSASASASTRKDKEALSIWDTTEQFEFFDIFMLALPPFLGIIGVADADRRRHRRVEHHERRRRGADARDRHQDGARRASSAGSCGSSCWRRCW